jgi:hypothetical protein
MSGQKPYQRWVTRCVLLGLISWLAAIVGCGAVLTTAAVSTPQSILKAVRTGSDRVTLEIFQVRVPADDKQLSKELWQAADEQRLDLDVRNRLVSNGFRAGVIAGTLPDALAKSLNLQSEMPEEQKERVIDEHSATPKVTRRVLQLKRGEPATIQTSEVQPLLNVLLNTESGLQGKSYQEVQGVYSLRAQTLPAQRVKVELVPELQHGEMRNRYAGSDQGILVVTPSRERKVFDQMKMSVPLTAGELLIVSGIPDAPASLGSAFHAEERAGVAEQKLVLIRLLQVPDSEILADVAVPAK